MATVNVSDVDSFEQKVKSSSTLIELALETVEISRFHINSWVAL